jgi:hypothetical protein
MHLGVIWILSFGSVPFLSIIDDWEVIYPRLVFLHSIFQAMC